MSPYGLLEQVKLLLQSRLKKCMKYYELSGEAKMAAGERTFSPKLHGTASFNTASGEFTDFRLIAAGQRSGKGGANGRATDLGPAPMAIALTMYKP